MSGLRILLTSSYYWPEVAGNAPYVTAVAEHLVRSGNDVTVIAGFPHYPEWTPDRRRLAAGDHHNGVEIRRRWHYVPRTQSAATRTLYESSLLASGCTALPRRRPDLVLAVLPTLAGGALARAAGALYRRPYGLVFQDVLGLAATQSGVRGGARVANLVRRAELRLARAAAAIGVIADGFARHFERHGIRPERIVRLRNWSQGEAPSEPAGETRARLGWDDDSYVCVHAGNMGHKQGLENVLGAAERLSGRSVQIVLAGDGNERASLEAIATAKNLTNVSFLPPTPPGEYEALLRAADALLVNQRATVGDMSLASKLTSYFAAGKPVVAAVSPASETARQLQAAEAGLLAEPDNPDALAAAILRLADDGGEAERYRRNALRYTEQELSAAAALRGYEELVERVASERR
jgi:colanic acid biosynthesis glycosyl transferase WcaI